MLQVNVAIKGDKETVDKLIKLGSNLTNFADAMGTIGKEVSGFYKGQVFSSQGQALGRKWKPLTPQYARHKAGIYKRPARQGVKRKIYAGAGINIATGKTQSSFTYDASKNKVKIYNTNMPLFAYLQLGTHRGMPARPMIGINNNVKTIIRTIVDNDIKRKLEKAGT